MTNLLLQLVSWKILYVLFVIELLNSLVYFSWLQHKRPLVLHGLQNLILWCLLSLKFLLTLLFIISILPIMSLRFLFLLYDIMDGSGKHSLTSGFICSIFQLDLSILLISGRVGLNAVVRGIRLLVL